MKDGALCMTYKEYADFSRPGRNHRECAEQNGLCNVVMQHDGWVTDFAIDRNYYADIKPACEAVAAFLDDMTIVREDVRRSVK